MSINTHKKKRSVNGKRRLQANWSVDLAADLKAMYDMDVESEMIKEMQAACDKIILEAIEESVKDKYVNKRLPF